MSKSKTRSSQTRSPRPLPEPEPAPSPQHPRPGSKQALIVDLLSRPEGASLDDLVAATGWLPHTARAALTGLRRRGFTIERGPAHDGRSVYRVAAPEPETANKARAGRRRGAAKPDAQASA